MKVINYKAFKDVPVCARVMYALACICAVIGITLIVLDVTEVFQTETCVQLAFCVAGGVINTCGLWRYKDKLYKEI